jgi:hypothetical protein
MEDFISLNLSSIPTRLINLEGANERLGKSREVLAGIGQPFERFEGLRHEVGVIGCGMSHLKLLTDIDPITLILEDDIDITEDTNKKITIPDGTDAIYLGVSNHGYIRNQNYGFKGTVLATAYSKDYLKVFNMCSTHAILYVSDRYIKACRSVITSCLQQGVAFDVGLASIHRHFKILTPINPWFYQTEQPKETNFSLIP